MLDGRKLCLMLKEFFTLISIFDAGRVHNVIFCHSSLQTSSRSSVLSLEIFHPLS